MLIEVLFSACITSIVRTYYTSRSETGDVSYKLVIMGLWTWAEVTIGILVACLPIAPRFFQHFGPKVFTSIKTKSTKSSLSSDKLRLNDHKSHYQLNDRPVEDDTFDKWDQSAVETSVRPGKELRNHDPSMTRSDIRVERSFLVSEGRAPTT